MPFYPSLPPPWGQKRSKVKEILIPQHSTPRAPKHKPNSSHNASVLANLDSLPQRSASILNGNYYTHTRTHIHSQPCIRTTWTVQMRCKRQRGEREEFREKQKRKWGVVRKKMGISVANQKKSENARKKSGGYVNVESESSGGKRRYNVLSWPGGCGAECPGASGGTVARSQWLSLCWGGGLRHPSLNPPSLFSLRLHFSPRAKVTRPGERWKVKGNAGRARGR